MTPSTGPGPKQPKVVLDTNVVVSSLLFSGITSNLVNLWQAQKIQPLLSKPILQEYIRVLSYPRFDLTDTEIKSLIEDELLPYVETVPSSFPKKLPSLRDKDDLKFLACSQTGRAHFLITGDKELLSLKKIGQTVIMKPSTFLGFLPP